MRENTRIYQAVAPQRNNAFVEQMLEGVAFNNYFPTERIVTTLASIPLFSLPDEDQEYYSGYRATVLLAQACLHKSLDNENSDTMSRMILTQMGNNRLSSVGEKFLDRGRLLILRDTSGKKLMSEIVEFLKENFLDKNFGEGAEDARSLFLAYWKEFEKRGLNYTDIPAPPKR